MATLLDQVYRNLISAGRWKLYVEGFGNTIIITIGAAILGIVLGCIVGMFKVTALQRREGRGNRRRTFADVIYRIVEAICDVYLTVIRGTPVVVQMLIFAFVIFASVPMNKMVLVAILVFGINSGAYVAEIVRAGINAVNIGQMEAGRSLGLGRGMTMRMIILPQAIKNILPALANEAIVLLKETAVVGYIAIADITYASTLVRSRTYSAIPLIFIAIVYLAVVMLMTWGLRKLERRLRKSDRR